jgi:hypothetical protein
LNSCSTFRGSLPAPISRMYTKEARIERLNSMLSGMSFDVYGVVDDE